MTPFLNYQIGWCYMKLLERKKAKKYLILAENGGYAIHDKIKNEFNI